MAVFSTSCLNTASACFANAETSTAIPSTLLCVVLVICEHTFRSFLSLPDMDAMVTAAIGSEYRLCPSPQRAHGHSIH